MKFAATLLFVTLIPALAQDPHAPRHLLGAAGPLTAADSAPPENIARRHLLSLASELSLGPADLDGVYIARQYRTEHNGVTHIVFRQRFQGADVLNAEWVENLDRDGRVLNVGGRLFTAPEGRSLAPMLRALTAVQVGGEGSESAGGRFRSAGKCTDAARPQSDPVRGGSSAAGRGGRSGLVCRARETAARMELFRCPPRSRPPLLGDG